MQQILISTGYRVSAVLVLGKSFGPGGRTRTRYSGPMASTYQPCLSFRFPFTFHSSPFAPLTDTVSSFVHLNPFPYLQANTSGVYTHATYNNRGILRTSSTSGSFEILTVPPGQYGPPQALRAGHIHAVISADGYESLTTQFYVCRGNDGKWMQSDL